MKPDESAPDKSVGTLRGRRCRRRQRSSGGGVCLHRSRGQRMLMVPLSPLRKMTAGTNFVLVCASPAKTTLHNCSTSRTSRPAQAHKRAWPRGDLGCAGRRRAACTCSVTQLGSGWSVCSPRRLNSRMHKDARKSWNFRQGESTEALQFKNSKFSG